MKFLKFILKLTLSDRSRKERKHLLKGFQRRFGFLRNNERLKFANYFRKKLYLTCLAGFWIRPCTGILLSFWEFYCGFHKTIRQQLYSSCHEKLLDVCGWVYKLCGSFFQGRLKQNKICYNLISFWSSTQATKPYNQWEIDKQIICWYANNKCI